MGQYEIADDVKARKQEYTDLQETQRYFMHLQLARLHSTPSQKLRVTLVPRGTPCTFWEDKRKEVRKCVAEMQIIQPI